MFSSIIQQATIICDSFEKQKGNGMRSQGGNDIQIDVTH